MHTTDNVDETPRERRLRQKREATARWMAKPENRRQYNERLAAKLATPEGKEAHREGTRRWLEKPGNREKAREASRLANAKSRATPEGREKAAAESAGPAPHDPTSC